MIEPLTYSQRHMLYHLTRGVHYSAAGTLAKNLLRRGLARSADGVSITVTPTGRSALEASDHG